MEKIKEKKYGMSNENQKAMTRNTIPYFMSTLPLEL
jgi:hypothetical protein